MEEYLNQGQYMHYQYYLFYIKHGFFFLLDNI